MNWSGTPRRLRASTASPHPASARRRICRHGFSRSVPRSISLAVPYGGAGPAVAAVVGNQVPIGCTAMPPTTPHIQGGRLRALAVTSAKRSEALPDVRTMAELGYKGQEAETLQGLMVPAGTPKEIVSRLHAEVVKIMAMPDVRKRVVELGLYIIANTPEQFAAQVKDEVQKWGKVIRSANIEVQ